MVTITIKRVYDNVAADDGYRVLVDRLWPRGIKKEQFSCQEWAKQLAPSTPLRQWYHNDANADWDIFVAKYHDELANNSEQLNDFCVKIKDRERVTLLYSAKDPQHNQALILKQFLKQCIQHILNQH